MQAVNLPYFDLVLNSIRRQEHEAAAFDRHVHWGYWPKPELADGTPHDYAQAAERLCCLLYEAAGVSNNMRVVDVGCGFGGTISSLNERYSDLDLTGVNIDERQLARARQTVTSKNFNSIQFVHGDACSLPFEDQSFDRVLAVEAIFHFPSRRQFFSEARRVLRKGGSLTISDFVPHPIAAPFLRLVEPVNQSRKTLKPLFGSLDPFCSLRNYKRLARKTGLVLSSQLDITKSTLPTYPFLRRFLEAQSDDVDQAALHAAAQLLEQAARGGIYSYQILTFTRC